MKNILNKFLILFLLLTIIFSLNSVSRAENEEVEEESGIIINNDDIMNMPIEEILKEELNSNKNFYKMSNENVTVDDNINGDVFIMCSQTVTINSHVSGNVFIMAKDVVIGENAKIDSSLFCASQTSIISGIVEKNTYVACENFTLDQSSHLGLDLFSAAERIVFNSSLARSAYITAESIEISKTSRIAGNLTYSSPETIEVPDDVVSGNISYTSTSSNIESGVKKVSPITSWIMSCLSFIVLAIIIFLISKKFDSNLIEKNLQFKQNIGKYILFGLLGLFVTPIINIVLLTTEITIAIGFILIFAYIILLLIASSVFINSVSILTDNKLKDKFTMNETLRQVVFVAICGVIYKAIQLIPVIGGLLTFAAWLIGAGILLRNITYKAHTDNIA